MTQQQQKELPYVRKYTTQKLLTVLKFISYLYTHKKYAK